MTEIVNVYGQVIKTIPDDDTNNRKIPPRRPTNEEILADADRKARDRRQAAMFRKMLAEGIVLEVNGTYEVQVEVRRFGKPRPKVKRQWQGLIPELRNYILRVWAALVYVFFGHRMKKPGWELQKAQNDPIDVACADLEAQIESWDRKIAEIGPPNPSVFTTDNSVA